MKKILLVIMLVICCTACDKTKMSSEIESSNKKPKLSDYSIVEKDVNNIISELKESGQFDDIEYDDFEKNELYNDPNVRYYVRYNTNCSDFDLSYNEKGILDGIHMAKDTGFCENEEQYFSELTHNQLLAITNLKRYNINETDFPGFPFGDTYEEYVNFMSGTSDKEIIYTNDNKLLILSYYPDKYIFYING